MQSLEVSCCGLSDEVTECSWKEEKNVLQSIIKSVLLQDSHWLELQGTLGKIIWRKGWIGPLFTTNPYCMFSPRTRKFLRLQHGAAAEISLL